MTAPARPLSPDDEGAWVLLRDEPEPLWRHIGALVLAVALCAVTVLALEAGVRVGQWWAGTR